MFEKDSTSNDIIRSERYLSGESSLPPVGRDEEIHSIRDAIRPLTKRETPETLLVHGPPGIGKTACVDYVFDALDRETSVKTIEINCWQYSTRPALLTELLIQLGYPAPRKGHPVDELLSKIREWLDKNRNVALLLDEFDQLQDKTEVAYDLHMLSQQTSNKIGLVLISNIPPKELFLDSRSWSRLNCRTLKFKPYNEDQLKEILKDRSEQAFKPGAVSEEVIEIIADQVAESGGDCRQAFDSLLQAGRTATQQGSREIRKRDLTKIDG